MKIENPKELAEAVSRIDALTAENTSFVAQLAEAVETKDAAATVLAAKEQAFVELQTQFDALATENTTIKDQLASADTSSQSFETALAEEKEKLERAFAANEIVIDLLAAKIEEFDALTVKLTELEGQLNAYADLAAKLKGEAVAATDQFALISAALTPRGAVPDLENPARGAAPEACKPYADWMKLSQSHSPADKIAARKIYNQNRAEIEAEVARRDRSQAPPPVQTATTVTAEQREVYAKWNGLLQTAKNALNQASGVHPADRHRIHAEAQVAARVLYNANKPAIDACIGAQIN